MTDAKPAGMPKEPNRLEPQYFSGSVSGQRVREWMEYAEALQAENVALADTARAELNAIIDYIMGYWPLDYCYVNPIQAIQVMVNRMVKAEAALSRKEEWVAVSERLPGEHIGKFLVTNNLHARDAFGHMSHVWLASLLHHDNDKGYYAFDDYDNRVPQHITHWMKLPAAPQREGEK